MNAHTNQIWIFIKTLNKVFCLNSFILAIFSDFKDMEPIPYFSTYVHDVFYYTVFFIPFFWNVSAV